MISSLVSRASAALLAIGGVALLFAADDILPRITPGFPEAGAWVGQLLAAPWLGVAALNWLNRSLVIGGIYGRPVVLANMALYFVSAMVLVQAARRPDSSAVLGWLVVPFALFAIVYAWLLFRGPLDRDLERRR